MRPAMIHAVLASISVCHLACAQAQHPFVPTASMNTARFGHTATLLPNGKVLILGGYSGNVSTGTAEVFDPVSETFSLVPNVMITARFRHTATMLPNGKILIVGGRAQTLGPDLDTAELFDPLTQTFTALPPTTEPRFGHTASLLADGRVLVAGGWNTAGAELFDPTSGTFAPTSGLMTMKRSFHSSTLLPDGNVLIVGGSGIPGRTVTAEVFKPATGTFASLAPATMTVIRSSHSATLLPSGRVLLAAGASESGFADVRSADLYDPVAQTFVRTLPDSITTPRYGHTATVLQDGKVLFAGGASLTYRTETAELFDPSQGTFKSLLPETMTSTRVGHTATLLLDGRVLIAGGYTDEHLDQGGITAELYKPVGGTTGFAAQAIQSITRLANGHILLQGNTTPNRDVAIYSSQGADRPYGRTGNAVADANGIFVYEDTFSTNGLHVCYRLALP